MALDDFVLDLIECRELRYNDEETADLLDCPTEILLGYEVLLKYSISNGKLPSLGISPETIDKITVHYSTLKRSPSKAQRIEEIREYAEIANDVGELVEVTGLSESTINSYASIGRIQLPGRRLIARHQPREQRIQQIRTSAETAPDLETMSEQTGLNKRTIKLYGFQEGIDLPEEKEPSLPLTPTRRPEIDELIAKGHTLKQIGDRVGSLSGNKKTLSRERVRQYINGTGQYEEWRRLRKLCSPEERKRTQLRFLRFLVKTAKQKCRDQQDPALEKAIEYYFSRKQKRLEGPTPIIQFEKIYSLFSSYFEAQQEGTPLALSDLGELSNIQTNTVGNILRRADLKPMHYPAHKKRIVTSPEKKQAIDRSYNLEMNAPDIAYFIGVSPWIVSQRFNDIGKRGKPHFIANLTKGRLDYRKASQIYEAQDLEFTEEQISELLDTHPDLVSHALQNESTIETKIIEALDTIYPETQHQKPYLD